MRATAKQLRKSLDNAIVHYKKKLDYYQDLVKNTKEYTQKIEEAEYGIRFYDEFIETLELIASLNRDESFLYIKESDIPLDKINHV